MWLYESPPLDRLASQFNFHPSPVWLDHLRLSSLQMGASASFISADGLIITNHHVALGGLHAISRQGRDYVKDGFLARTREQEVKLPGATARVLVSIEDVTDQINVAVPETLPADKAVEARHAVIANIERESESATKLESRVITLYGGARYHLYRYKRYDDIRIVFAPELATAFFGGDPDNFEYPRYCLDVSVLRAYENGHPAKIEHYLKWSTTGVAEGDLVFVSGNPHRTDRLLPAAVLEGMRDQAFPFRKEVLERAEKVVVEYGKRSPECARQAADDLFYIQNSLKTVRPRLKFLQDSDLIARHRREEAQLKGAISGEDPFKTIDESERVWKKIQLRHDLLEGAAGLNSRLFAYARTLVRLPVEDAKPDDQRLPEFNKAKRATLLDRLNADDPVYPELDAALLADSLQLLIDKLGSDDSTVRSILAGKSPRDRADEFVKHSKLGAPAERQRLQHGGAAAIDASDDPMIQLARLVDPESRRLRKEMESSVTEPQTQAMAQINKARFAAFGSALYPDATGSLRLALGVVKSYDEHGEHRPAWTTIGGAFQHQAEHKGKPPYRLPDRWFKPMRYHPALDTPLNFISTADITGGNSGSPVVNRAGEFVGIIFDSNRQGVLTDFAYTDDQARSIAVDSRGIIEAMEKVYGADNLVREILGKP